jgi:hypothetical protein
MMQIEVQEDVRDNGRIGEKGENLHLAPAARAGFAGQEGSSSSDPT